MLHTQRKGDILSQKGPDPYLKQEKKTRIPLGTQISTPVQRLSTVPRNFDHTCRVDFVCMKNNRIQAS